MKFTPTLLIALLLAVAWPLHAADLSLLSEGKSDYQIVVPDSLETLALTECLNQTARLVQTTFAENGAEVAVVTESQRDATKPALLLGNTRFAKEAAAMAVRSKSKRSPAMQQAMDWLELALANGSRPSKEVIKEGNEHGFDKRMLQRALRELDGKPEKVGFEGGWIWLLPTGFEPLLATTPHSPESILSKEILL